ncbi:hypothetical protein QFZ30_002453 [Arthrobacter pascens]|uniref:hypothetical protein n=1 Tax=Arthrobacter pascens TaxID=1677 RepID=UPI002791D328|nr:hypothetical protein [Arthrobacter pascens]MDQ0679071.1 hypothetical protein [Arthrobacter pascens]
MDAHVVFCAGEWKRVSMDGFQCDRHPSAQAKAKVLFPNLGTLYLCGHCANAFEDKYVGPFHITYETVTLDA